MPVFSRKTVILDLGASRIALGVFSRSNGRLRLDDFAVENFSGQPGGETGWLQQTRAALAVLRARTGARGSVVLVLPPHLTLTKLIKTPRVARAKRGKILRFEAEQSIPYAPSEVIWDTVVAAEHETELEMLLAAAKREAIEALCGVLQASGFEPHRVLPSSLATLAAFRLLHGTPMEPTLVLNLGARSTTLLQVAAQRFTVRSLALGTSNIMWKTAEQRDHIALEIIATRLAQEITRSVLHFRRQGGGETPARICLAGGGTRFSGLGEALAAKLKVPVEQLDFTGSIGIGRGVAEEETAGHPLMFADLVGAAATQLRSGQPVLNLLPSSLRKQANRRRRMWLAAAALATAALWSIGGYLRPTVEPVRAATVIGHETAPRPAETLAPPTGVSDTEEERPFGLELLDVRTAPFPLQLAGYFGEAGDYVMAFVSGGQAEPQLARCGHRFERLGLTLRSFVIRKVAVKHDDAWPVYEVAAFAVLHDEKTGTEIVLDSRRKPTGTLQAVLRDAPDRQPSTRQEGELIVQGDATYRIQHIQADPPEVVVLRQAGDSSMPATRVLQLPRPANDRGEQAADAGGAFEPNGL